MRLLITVLLAITFYVSETITQWEQISTIGNNELRGVKFFNEHTGIIVGQGGIWRSTNSGVNWINVLSASNLNSISFFDSNNGYAVGDSGKIFRTLNNGLNWFQQAVGITSSTLYGASFSTTVRFHAVGAGGIILRTGNGGSTWSTQTLSGQTFYSVIVDAGSVGYSAGSTNNEIIYGTINGGTNWISLLSMSGNNCNDITFINNSNSILLVGNDGRIRRSANSGLNWTFPLSNVSNTLNSVSFSNPNTGFITGNNGIILKTTDSGFTWMNQTTGYSNNFFDISFINEQTGWAVGSNGLILRTGIPVGINQIGTNIIDEFELYQNYPNPFNPLTNIKFKLFSKGLINLRIFSINGEILELINQNLDEGTYEIPLSSNNLSSGVYFCVLQNGKQIKSIKLILLK